MAISTALSGSASLDGKFKNDQEVVMIVLGTVKAEPHRVSTASGGAVTKMSVRMVEAILAEPGAETNTLRERIAAMVEERDGDPNQQKLVT